MWMGNAVRCGIRVPRRCPRSLRIGSRGQFAEARSDIFGEGCIIAPAATITTTGMCGGRGPPHAGHGCVLLEQNVHLIAAAKWERVQGKHENGTAGFPIVEELDMSAGDGPPL